MCWKWYAFALFPKMFNYSHSSKNIWETVKSYQDIPFDLTTIMFVEAEDQANLIHNLKLGPWFIFMLYSHWSKISWVTFELLSITFHYMSLEQELRVGSNWSISPNNHETSSKNHNFKQFISAIYFTLLFVGPSGLEDFLLWSSHAREAYNYEYCE